MSWGTRISPVLVSFQISLLYTIVAKGGERSYKAMGVPTIAIQKGTEADASRREENWESCNTRFTDEGTEAQRAEEPA